MFFGNLKKVEIMRRLKFLMPVGFLAVAALISVVVMALWNWLMPAVFGLGTIGFWQAAGIFVLSRILFGGFGGGQGFRKRKHHAGGHPILNKWKNMTPGQRQEFVRKRREHFGRGDFFGGRGFDFETDENTSKNHE